MPSFWWLWIWYSVCKHKRRRDEGFKVRPKKYGRLVTSPLWLFARTPLLPGLMPVTYTQFLTLIATALRDENGLDLAYLIRPVSPHSKDLIKEFRNPTVRRIPIHSH